MTDARDALFVAQASDGRTVRRPLSPHIGIYRWPATMVGSILNRATGVALCAGPAPFAAMQAFVASPLGLLLLLGWTASLFFHLFGGLRHLLWDVGIGTEKPGLDAGTYVVAALTLGATAAVWLAGYAVAGR